MKRKLLNILVLFVSTVLMSSAEVYNIYVGQFDKLKINGNIGVIYSNLPDSTGYARFEAPEGFESLFNFTVKGDGILKVEPGDTKWGNRDLPLLFVYSNFLNSIECYSDKQVEVVSIAPCATFNVNQVGNGSILIDNLKCNNISASISTGNGSILLTGVCVNANFRMVGAGLISADRLKAENVKCRILGTGSIGCWATDKLNVTGLGTTKIYYKGDPEIKKKGGGKLFELPEEIENASYSVATPVNISEKDDGGYDEDDEDDEDEEDEEDDDYRTVVTEDD